MNQKKPTIVDVAKHADVAIGTVSRFLNGLSIRDGNRRRIEASVSELGYSANMMARSMKTERTQSIGLLVPKFDEFNSAILTILVNELQACGYSLLTFHHGHQPKAMSEALEAAASRRIDGLILSGTEEIHEKAASLIDRGLPITLFNNDLPGLATDKVLVNDRRATADAVSRIIGFGHTRIGLVTGDLVEATANNRLQGYKDALAAANIPVDEALIYNTDWQSTGGHAATSKFLSMDDGPSAVFYSSYVLAIGALECMRSAGLTPGERLHLVSFDDPDLFSLTTPGITAIAQPTAAIARALAQITLSRLNGERDQAPRTITLDCDLMLRGSLGMNTGTPK